MPPLGEEQDAEFDFDKAFDEAVEAVFGPRDPTAPPNKPISAAELSALIASITPKPETPAKRSVTQYEQLRAALVEAGRSRRTQYSTERPANEEK